MAEKQEVWCALAVQEGGQQGQRRPLTGLTGLLLGRMTSPRSSLDPERLKGTLLFLSLIAPSPLSNYPVRSVLGRDGYWGCMDQILTCSGFDQGFHFLSASAGSLTLPAAGREGRVGFTSLL